MRAGRIPENPILLVDDEQAVVDSLSLMLRSNGIDNITPCTDSREVMAILRERRSSSLFSWTSACRYLPGEKLLAAIHEEMPQVPVIVVTGTNEVSDAVECMKAGAFDYMVKAVEESRLVSGVRRAIEISKLSRDYRRLKDGMLSPHLAHPEAFARMVTSNGVMTSLFRIVESIAKSDEPILITGRDGHRQGPGRRRGPRGERPRWAPWSRSTWRGSRTTRCFRTRCSAIARARTPAPWTRGAASCSRPERDAFSGRDRGPVDRSRR